jgi:hypothetical protein
MTFSRPELIPGAPDDGRCGLNGRDRDFKTVMTVNVTIIIGNVWRYVKLTPDKMALAAVKT